jgi:hypothetical protein
MVQVSLGQRLVTVVLVAAVLVVMLAVLMLLVLVRAVKAATVVVEEIAPRSLVAVAAAKVRLATLMGKEKVVMVQSR